MRADFARETSQEILQVEATEKGEMLAASENGLEGDPRLKAISDSIRVVPHFPKPGAFYIFLS